jgi:hypothetical protein
MLIKKSIPYSLVFKDDYFFFRTKDKFADESFTKFNKVSRLNQELTRILVSEFTEYFGLTLYGMDILVKESN